MRRDDRDDPFGDIFDEIERMMGGGDAASDTHVDVHETDDLVRLVADLPGVTKEAIDLKCDGESLTIAAETDGRRYDERVRLPTPVDEHSASASFNNGVLEVELEKVGESADIDL